MNTRRTIVIGQRFLMLVVLKRIGLSSCRRPKTLWLCQCDCGQTTTVVTANLGRIHSCGCFQKGRQPTHGMSRTRTHKSWSGMFQRCENPKDTAYPRYGGRGIKVCPQWRKFEQFLKDMGECPEGLTIDRKDNDGNYTPENCRWATRQTQSENRRWVVWIEFNGVRKTRAQWAREIGITTATLRDRLASNWPLEQALSRPKSHTWDFIKGRPIRLAKEAAA